MILMVCNCFKVLIAAQLLLVFSRGLKHSPLADILLGQMSLLIRELLCDLWHFTY